MILLNFKFVWDIFWVFWDGCWKMWCKENFVWFFSDFDWFGEELFFWECNWLELFVKEDLLLIVFSDDFM